jgi:hypothetical protein
MWILDRIDPSRDFLDDEGATAVTTRWIIAVLMFGLIAYLIFGLSTTLIDGFADWLFC